MAWGSGERRSQGQRAVASLICGSRTTLLLCGAPFRLQRAGPQQPLPVLTAYEPSFPGTAETDAEASVTGSEKRDGRGSYLCSPPPKWSLRMTKVPLRNHGSPLSQSL